MRLTTKPGIYRIQSIVTGRSYIGQAQNISKRCAQHRSLLKNKGDSPDLQDSYDLYGHMSLVYSVLEICQLDDGLLTDREVHWKYYFDINGGTYNKVKPGRHVRTENAKYEYVCAGCGEIFLEWASQITTDHPCCGWECRGKVLSQTHPNKKYFTEEEYKQSKRDNTKTFTDKRLAAGLTTHGTTPKTPEEMKESYDKMSEDRKGAGNPMYQKDPHNIRPMYSLDLDGNRQDYRSSEEASAGSGLSRAAIFRSLKKNGVKGPEDHNLSFFYLDGPAGQVTPYVPPPKAIRKKYKKTSRGRPAGRTAQPVIRINPDTGEETQFPSQKEAAELNGIAPQGISASIKKGGLAGGYYWRPVDIFNYDIGAAGRSEDYLA